MRTLPVLVAVAFFAFLIGLSGVTEEQSGAFKKFALWYPQGSEESCIGCGDQMEIDLTLTSSSSAFSAEVAVNVTAAGGIYDHTLGTSVQNVTITLSGAQPYGSQPKNGIIVNPFQLAGVVLFPASQCTIHATGAILYPPYLCGPSNEILWQKAGTYHPFITIYLNNGSKPLTENDTADSVTVVSAPAVTTTSTSTSTFTTTTTASIPPKRILGVAVDDPQNWLFVSVVLFFETVTYALFIARPRLRKKYRSESGRFTIDTVITIVVLGVLVGLFLSFPYDYQPLSLQTLAIIGWFFVLWLAHSAWKRFARPVQRQPHYGEKPSTHLETKKGSKHEEPKKGQRTTTRTPRETARPSPGLATLR